MQHLGLPKPTSLEDTILPIESVDNSILLWLGADIKVETWSSTFCPLYLSNSFGTVCALLSTGSSPANNRRSGPNQLHPHGTWFGHYCSRVGYGLEGTGRGVGHVLWHRSTWYRMESWMGTHCCCAFRSCGLFAQLLIVDAACIHCLSRWTLSSSSPIII